MWLDPGSKEKEMPGSLSISKVSKYLPSTSYAWNFLYRWGRVAVKQSTKRESDNKVQNR